MNEIRFDGQVAIVTGAGGGLGRTYALELARRGARVVVNDLGGSRDGTGAAAAPARAVVDEITGAGGEAVASFHSVADPEGGAAIVQCALDAFGTVDIVINNAGIIRDRTFANLPVADMESVLNVHLLGAFHVTQHAFRVMKVKQYGRVLFTSSAAGVFGNFGQANYSAAKMGVVGLASTLAIEGAKYGITSNVIMPMAASRLTDGLMGEYADIAGPEKVTPLVTYLVSRECATTHEIYSAGGGRYARVFIGVGPGWFAAGDPPSAEEIARQFDTIRTEAGYALPMSATGEANLLLPHLVREPS